MVSTIIPQTQGCTKWNKFVTYATVDTHRLLIYFIFSPQKVKFRITKRENEVNFEIFNHQKIKSLHKKINRFVYFVPNIEKYD